jgi:nitrogen fixation protein NifB
VDPAVAAALYAWIRPGQRTLALDEAAALLVRAQAEAIAAFKRAGLFVKVNTTLYPGINDAHMEDIAKAMAALGADLMAVLPFQPPAAPAASGGAAPGGGAVGF